MNDYLEKTLPERIFKLVDGKYYEIDDTGMSGAQILIFDQWVLKKMPVSAKNDDIVTLMKWLEGKIPAPKVIAYERDDKYNYLLMSRLTGQMSCDKYYLEHPKELLDWLYANKPDLEPVFSHGDFCLPNILIENGEISGFIDLDHTGIADKWRDIALCYRSLKHNFDGTYGGKVYPDFNPDMLFTALGMEPDWEKLNYYILLDELF